MWDGKRATSLHRCLHRHGISQLCQSARKFCRPNDTQLPDVEGGKPAKKNFKA